MAFKQKYFPTPEQINSGLCHCGCGQKTKMAALTSTSRGHFKGFPLAYVHGHSRRGTKSKPRFGPDAGCWKGGRINTTDGYVAIYNPTHRLANKMGYVLEHRLVWDNAHGLDAKQHVHHIDGNRSNNALDNLAAISHSDHARHHGYTQSAAKRAKISESVKRVWANRKRH
jgi:hypothetical protein